MRIHKHNNNNTQLTKWSKSIQYYLSGKGHLACVSFAGGRAFPRRKNLFADDDRVRNDVQYLSHYKKNIDAAGNPQQASAGGKEGQSPSLDHAQQQSVTPARVCRISWAPWTTGCQVRVHTELHSLLCDQSAIASSEHVMGRPRSLYTCPSSWIITPPPPKTKNWQYLFRAL